jgi:diguanylate cyclase (GGDEF)-like protein
VTPSARTQHIRPVLPGGGLARPWWPVVVLGLALLVRSASHLDLAALPSAGFVFPLVLGLVLLGELRPVVTPGAADPAGVNLSMAFIFAILMMWGPALAIVSAFTATAIGELAKRKRLWVGLFNACQYVVSYAAAGGVLALLGVEASPTDPLQLAGHHLPRLVLAALAYHVVNLTLVSWLLAAESGRSLRDEFLEDIGYYTATTFAVLALSPLVVAVSDEGAALILLLAPPLYAVWRTAQMSVQQEHRSLHDPLTGLPNRTLLGLRVEAAVSELVRKGHEGGLLLLDLDQFKEVNDTLGHLVGDELLQAVAGRLTGAVRSEDTVSRLGGDEFAVLLPDAAGVEQVTEVAERLAAAVAEPLHVDHLLLEVRASVGIALIPDHGTTLPELLRCADVAMYEAKRERTVVEVYAAERDDNSPARLSLLTQLRRALRTEELVLHYQPKVRIDDGRVIGVEALLRWDRPDLGLVSPEDFLPQAEHAGLMPEITTRVLTLALDQARAWHAAGLPLQVAVNVTTRDLADGRLPQRLVEELAARSLPRSAIRLEVTEDTLMTHGSRTLDTIGALDEVGIALSLDDFGTGHSSLARLKELPVTELKIDRHFIGQMATDDVAIVRSIVSLARALEIPTVGEGVETPAQLEILRRLGCVSAQGYLIAAPAPADAVTVWLAGRELAEPAGAPVPTPSVALN